MREMVIEGDQVQRLADFGQKRPGIGETGTTPKQAQSDFVQRYALMAGDLHEPLFQLLLEVIQEREITP